MADIYAVVDKSKKQNEGVDQNMALYAMVEKCNFDSETEYQPESNSPQATVKDVPYSGNPEASKTTTFAASEKSKGQNAKPNISRLVWCLLALTIAVILLAIISLVCIIALFNEISKLESEASRPQQGVASSVSPIINGSFSHLADQLSLINAHLLKFQEAVSNNSQEQLIAMEILKNETFSVLNNSFALLESQIEQLGNQTEQLENQTDKLEIQLESQTEQLTNQTQQLEEFFVSVSQFMVIPASSCAALPPSSPSGYYWVRSSNGSAVSVYCDMTRSCNNITGGWMRVAELNMTNSCHQCPSSLMERTDSSIRTCVKNTAGECSEVQYSTSQIQYSRVCGKVIAYSVESVDAFGRRSTSDINSYVDGVSLTHGDPREHIWTFAAGLSDYLVSSCKCINSSAPNPPSFVGMDYFCDSAERPERLWDGVGCMPPNNCCTFNTPPWFYKQLLHPTTDDIEMRVCRDEDGEDIQIEAIELFVQ